MQLPASLDVVRTTVRALTMHREPRAGAKRVVGPIVTISREAGIDVSAVTRPLVAILNDMDDEKEPWIEYDRKLVAQVAEDHQIAKELVSRLDERDKSWFEHLVGGLTGTATGTDVAMKMARTIRGLSRVGRAVIVGRGGQCILAGMGHVVHVRLFAPLAWRVGRYAEAEGVSRREAEKAVDEMESGRARFIRSHFNHDVADAFLYDVLINMARVDGEVAARMIARMVEAARKRRSDEVTEGGEPTKRRNDE